MSDVIIGMDFGSSDETVFIVYDVANQRLVDWITAADLGPAPPGQRWLWSAAKQGWILGADPTAAQVQAVSEALATPVPSPVVGRGGDWFHMPAKRRAPLSAQHSGVVAAGEAVRRMR